MLKRALVVVLLILLTVITVSARKSSPTTKRQYRVPRVESKIQPDGYLKEDVWKKALVLELKYEVYPSENTKAKVRTEVLLAYSKHALYIAFRAFDPDPSKIQARISDRDTIGSQDWVAVVLDTFNDKRRSFDFLCNPYGVQEDMIETQDEASNDWDTIWDSGGRITKEGYVVEMSIPFHSLRFQRSEGDQIWGFDALRCYPRSTQYEFSVFPHDRNNSCYLCQSIKLIGFRGAKPGKNLEFDPTLSAHVIQQRPEGTKEPFTKESKLEPGITARWGFTPNLTLSAAVNPDFSQVEADSLQLAINEPFALSFSEKRPFFTEGADYFATPMNAVYTRAIRNPSWGIKITGKEAGNTVGAYMVRDDVTNLIFPGSQGSISHSIAMASTASVLRYSRDIGSKYTLGALFTNRQGTDYYNRVFGFDGDFRITDKDRVLMQILGSSTQYPDHVAGLHGQKKGRFNDKAINIQYMHDARNLDWYAVYNDMGDDFRADMGFIPQVDYRSFGAGADYIWYGKPGQWWSRFQVEVDYEQKANYDGQLLGRQAEISFIYQGPLQMHTVLEYNREREFYHAAYYNQNHFLFHHCMRPSGDVFTFFNILVGDRVDYSNKRPARQFQLNPGFTYYIGKHLQIDLEHTYEYMKANSKKLYTANQTELSLVYQINKRTFIRSIFQYEHYTFNTANYHFPIDPLYKHLFSQFLFSYKINPQTVLFLGYTDNYHGFRGLGFPQSDRTFFLKIGYALVM